MVGKHRVSLESSPSLAGAARAERRALPIPQFSPLRAGFSLIEVMVAIVILAIALTGLTQGITTALGNSKESELQATAALFAAGQIELLRAQTDWTDGSDDGNCGTALALYRWRQTISPTDVDGLHEVDVVVEDARSGRTIYELKTMLFQTPEDANAKGRPPKSRDHRT
jgi:general secretion pathway protein I